MNESTKTIGELLQEAEAFRYSQEYYELYKECCEADLMAVWLEGQEYRKYNDELLKYNEGYSFNESYLVESADDEKIQAITEKWQEKIKSIGNTIYTALEKIIKTLIAFFKRLMNINNAKLESYREKLSTPESIKILVNKQDETKKIIEDNWKTIASGEASSVKLWTPDMNIGKYNSYGISGTLPNTNIEYRQLLSLSLEKYNIKLKLNDPKAVAVINENEKINENKIKNIREMIASGELKSLKRKKNDSITISVGNEHIEKSIKVLNDYLAAIAKAKETPATDTTKKTATDDKSSSVDTENTPPSPGAANMAKDSTNLITGFKNLMQIYRDLYTYRNGSIRALYKLISSKGSAKSVSNKEENENTDSKD